MEPHSAGTHPKGLDPLAVEVMSEAGVDITSQRSKDIVEFKDLSLDWVVTVCGHAQEQCPLFPGQTRVVHVGFEDPPMLSRDATSHEEKIVHYRRVRDEIRRYVESLPDVLPSSSNINMGS